MKNGKPKRSYTRIVLYTVALLIQYSAILSAVMTGYHMLSGFALICRAVSVILLFYILAFDQKDSCAVKPMWILFISLFPGFFSAVYLINGHGRQNAFMKKAANPRVCLPEKLESGYAANSRRIISQARKNDIRACAAAVYLERSGFPAFDGNVLYYPTGEDAFAGILTEMQKAEKFIFIEFFIIEESRLFGKMLEIIDEKLKKGVDVRIIYDDFGSIVPAKSSFGKELEKKHKGLRCLRFHPMIPIIGRSFNSHNHRKSVIIDGRIAFSGGMNVADRYINIASPFGYWKDCGFSVIGRAVDEYTLSFAKLWNACRRRQKISLEKYTGLAEEASGCLVQPFFDNPADRRRISKTLFLDMINKSENELMIMTPYLIPDTELMTALRDALGRGVKITLFAHKICDKKAVFVLTKRNLRQLRGLGADVYLFNRGFIHSKAVLCDRDCTLLSTANADIRSFYSNLESGVFVIGEETANAVRADFARTINESTRMSKKMLRSTPGEKLLYPFIRIFENFF